MAHTTLWPWESHSISAFQLFTIGWKKARYSDGRRPFQLKIPRLLSSLLRSRATYGRRSAGRAHLALRPGAGVAGASSTLTSDRHRERISPGSAYPLRPRPARAHLDPDRYASNPPGAQRPEEPSSPQRPAQAICPLLSPQRGRAGRGAQLRNPARLREVRAAQLPGQAPRIALGASVPALRARISGAGSSGKKERGWGSDGCRGGVGGLGAPAGWEDGTQSQSWTVGVQKAGGRVLLPRTGLGGAGAGEYGDDLVVTWDLWAVALAYLFACCPSVWIITHPSAPSNPHSGTAHPKTSCRAPTKCFHLY